MNGHGGLCRALVRAGATLALPNNAGVTIFNHPVATKQLLFRLLDTLHQVGGWIAWRSNTSLREFVSHHDPNYFTVQ